MNGFCAKLCNLWFLVEASPLVNWFIYFEKAAFVLQGMKQISVKCILFMQARSVVFFLKSQTFIAFCMRMFLLCHLKSWRKGKYKFSSNFRHDSLHFVEHYVVFAYLAQSELILVSIEEQQVSLLCSFPKKTLAPICVGKMFSEVRTEVVFGVLQMSNLTLRVKSLFFCRSQFDTKLLHWFCVCYSFVLYKLL